ncbi:unnamed protein product [Amoebophrya sp. A25]|nr:unnamed protein product [Amoebophrya sp. A25]|eukprot:GSA25T00017095001.1
MVMQHEIEKVGARFGDRPLISFGGSSSRMQYGGSSSSRAGSEYRGGSTTAAGRSSSSGASTHGGNGGQMNQVTRILGGVGGGYGYPTTPSAAGPGPSRIDGTTGSRHQVLTGSFGGGGPFYDDERGRGGGGSVVFTMLDSHSHSSSASAQQQANLPGSGQSGGFGGGRCRNLQQQVLDAEFKWRHPDAPQPHPRRSLRRCLLLYEQGVQSQKMRAKKRIQAALTRNNTIAEQLRYINHVEADAGPGRAHTFDGLVSDKTSSNTTKTNGNYAVGINVVVNDGDTTVTADKNSTSSCTNTNAAERETTRMTFGEVGDSKTKISSTEPVTPANKETGEDPEADEDVFYSPEKSPRRIFQSGGSPRNRGGGFHGDRHAYSLIPTPTAGSMGVIPSGFASDPLEPSSMHFHQLPVLPSHGVNENSARLQESINVLRNSAAASPAWLELSDPRTGARTPTPVQRMMRSSSSLTTLIGGAQPARSASASTILRSGKDSRTTYGVIHSVPSFGLRSSLDANLDSLSRFNGAKVSSPKNDAEEAVSSPKNDPVAHYRSRSVGGVPDRADAIASKASWITASTSYNANRNKQGGSQDLSRFPHGYAQVVDRLLYWSLQRQLYNNPHPVIRQIPRIFSQQWEPFSFGDGTGKRVPELKTEFLCEVIIPRRNRCAYRGKIRIRVRQGADLHSIASAHRQVYGLTIPQAEKLLRTLVLTRTQIQHGSFSATPSPPKDKQLAIEAGGSAAGDTDTRKRLKKRHASSAPMTQSWRETVERDADLDRSMGHLMPKDGSPSSGDKRTSGSASPDGLRATTIPLNTKTNSKREIRPLEEDEYEDSDLDSGEAAYTPPEDGCAKGGGLLPPQQGNTGGVGVGGSGQNVELVEVDGPRKQDQTEAATNEQTTQKQAPSSSSTSTTGVRRDPPAPSSTSGAVVAGASANSKNAAPGGGPTSTSSATNNNSSTKAIASINSNNSSGAVKVIYDGDLLRRIVYAKIFLLGVQDERGFDIALDQMQSLVTWEDVQCRPILRGEKEKDTALGKFFTQKGLVWWKKHNEAIPEECVVWPGSIEEQARALNNGVFRELVDPRGLSEFLVSQKSSNLLQRYYKMWAETWAAAYFSSTLSKPWPHLPRDPLGQSGERLSTSPVSRNYARRVGRMMLDVMKAGFTQALLFPGGKGTERLLDAFVDGIIAVEGIMEKLKPCFLSRTGGGVSRDSAEEMPLSDRVLLICTMTMMLAGGSQRNRWSREKFVAVGLNDAGVHENVMKKIFDKIDDFGLVLV